MGSDQTVIKVSNLKKAYGDVQAVNGVSFSVDCGEIFGLLGPNGAGKTTTLSIVEGLLKADTGTVNVLGHDGNQNGIEIKQKMGVPIFMLLSFWLPSLAAGADEPDMMPAIMNSITPWLPTSMAIELIGVLFYSGHLPENAIFDLVGLFVYLLLFSILSAWKLRWEK